MTIENFDFKNINLIPKMGIVESRNECNTSVIIGKNSFKLPIYPANMESIINIELAEELASKGYFYTMHRFDVDNISFIRKMKDKNLFTSISIGVNFDSYRLLEKLEERDLIPDYITIDIAHGHCIKMKKMLEYISNRSFKTFVIAGNICTPKAAKDLIDWGADGVKVGIAPGYVCTTAYQTGFGSRGMQASTVYDIRNQLSDPTFVGNCYNANKYSNVFIVCDGGIREHGDIAKALVCGADLVMAGSMFAGYKESPGNLIDNGDDNKVYKEYWGSASQYQSGKSNRIEGKKTLILYKDKSIFEELKSIEESLQSAISYAGGKDLNAFNFVEMNLIS